MEKDKLKKEEKRKKEIKNLEIIIGETCKRIKSERSTNKQRNYFEEMINSVDGVCDEYDLHNFEFYKMIKGKLGARKYNSLISYLDGRKKL